MTLQLVLLVAAEDRTRDRLALAPITWGDADYRLSATLPGHLIANAPVRVNTHANAKSCRERKTFHRSQLGSVRMRCDCVSVPPS